MAHQRDIVVLGGSAGSGEVLKRLVMQLPRDLPAAICVTTHVPAHSAPLLPDILAGRSSLPVLSAVDGQPISPGRIYLAPPDRHLLLFEGIFRLGYGPRENMSRPAIDPMFRSAAFSYRERVIGVILTGMLNDGAAGLHAVKQCGGVAVVQHPLDAAAAEMPRAAIEGASVDHVVKAEDLAELLSRLVAETPAKSDASCAADLELEILIAAGRRLGSEELTKVADPTPITCPHCQGVMSEMKGEGPLRYRCQIGHAFTAEALLSANEQTVDEAMRLALRIMEERLVLVSRMAADAKRQGRTAVAELYEQRAREYEGYAQSLRAAANLALRMAKIEP